MTRCCVEREKRGERSSARLMSPYNRPAAFVCFNPPKQRPSERFSFRPPVVSIQSHSNRCRGHAHAHVALLFRRPAREFYVYLDIRRALLPSNATVVWEREVLASAVGGDQRAARFRARGGAERDFGGTDVGVRAFCRHDDPSKPFDERADDFDPLFARFFCAFFFPIQSQNTSNPYQLLVRVAQTKLSIVRPVTIVLDF